LETSQLTILATAIDGMKNSLLAVLGIVAIPACLVLGAYLVWHFGIGFFKRLGGR
jgi:hypothetical protein